MLSRAHPHFLECQVKLHVFIGAKLIEKGSVGGVDGATTSVIQCTMHDKTISYLTDFEVLQVSHRTRRVRMNLNVRFCSVCNLELSSLCVATTVGYGSYHDLYCHQEADLPLRGSIKLPIGYTRSVADNYDATPPCTMHNHHTSPPLTPAAPMHTGERITLRGAAMRRRWLAASAPDLRASSCFWLVTSTLFQKQGPRRWSICGSYRKRAQTHPRSSLS